MQTTSLEFGLPGIGLEPGDHVCAFYLGSSERNDVVVPYLRAGLNAGHKCIGVVDSDEPQALLETFDADEGVQACVDSHQLQLWSSRGTYIQDGLFSTSRMLEFWEDGVGTAVRSGRFECVRVFGEMTWSLRDVQGADELADYESEVNRFAPKYPQVILCLYDLNAFGGGILVDQLATHPKILLGGMLFENPHYLSPDEFRATRR